ncbi:hypothetical protein OENI_40003 [Oenococcus oeni]|uniref:Uncharacterized protein n=1 Tax=Oenococcus oeni TaxID=1247 RepID=A0AAQ2UVE4_OENOE|nr:hypothetical protein OENI_40003 [Oenococcus oeni]SYW05691.1 hypothetical protein OENI_140003 [Oenococcus oeni]SYW11463.1 hypothetical protein OENI_110003 [Oenococcus oeni]VDB97690.1 protein of unknown function [Oenococcus oeni]
MDVEIIVVQSKVKPKNWKVFSVPLGIQSPLFHKSHCNSFFLVKELILFM